LIFLDKDIKKDVATLIGRLNSIEYQRLNAHSEYSEQHNSANSRITQLEQELANTNDILVMLLRYMNLKVVKESKRLEVIV